MHKAKICKCFFSRHLLDNSQLVNRTKVLLFHTNSVPKTVTVHEGRILPGNLIKAAYITGISGTTLFVSQLSDTLSFQSFGLGLTTVPSVTDSVDQSKIVRYQATRLWAQAKRWNSLAFACG